MDKVKLSPNDEAIQQMQLAVHAFASVYLIQEVKVTFTLPDNSLYTIEVRKESV